jgi:ketosteroid isomerase-like protein
MASSLTKLCVLIFSVTCSVSASDLPRVAEQAIAARQKTMQQDATAADVDAFLAFGTENLTYEDPVVKMKIEGRDQIRQGMVSFLGLSRRARITITKQIAVANLVVLTKTFP